MTEKKLTKKEIVSFFLDNGIFLNPKILEKITPENYLEIYESYKSTEKETKNKINTSLQNLDESNVNVLFSYQEDPKKRKYEDFVSLFIWRYNQISAYLRARPNLGDALSIKRIKEKRSKENVSFICTVSNKYTTKSGHIMFETEDLTGTINVLINKSRKDLFEIASGILEDEIIAIKGSNAENIVFANEIFLPDLPIQQVKKSPNEAYAIFLSDIHVGSTYFLEEQFSKFIKWIKGESGNEKQKKTAKKINYIFIAGDLVDGVGIYPNQIDELNITDVKEQYKKCAEYLKQIPPHIKIIVCSGNHDAARIAEPQPPPYQEFAEALYNLPNLTMVSNPSLINIHSSKDFEGFNILLYHGYSFDYFIANIDNIRLNGGYDRVDLVMKHLLQRRHLAPTYSSTPYLPTEQDHLIIDKIPDFFITGHVHKCAISSYKNVTLISGSCCQSTTSFQEKMGHKPEPGRVPVVNLKTREVRILRFQ